MNNIVTICCALFGGELPNGATMGKCSLCHIAIIFDEVGVKEVSIVEGKTPKLLCASCLLIVCKEEGPPNFKGWARDAR